MGDDSRSSLVQTLKNEWSLFWDSLTPAEKTEDPFKTGRLKILSVDEVRAITKALSQDRRRLHQRLEKLHKEIDLAQAKLDSLRLVGGSPHDTVSRMNELNDQGAALSNELQKLDEKLRAARDLEKGIGAVG